MSKQEWKDFPKQLINDIKNKPWPEGTTTEAKNEYRWKVIYLMGALAVLGIFLFPPYSLLGSLAAAIVAVRKYTIIKTDK